MWTLTPKSDDINDSDFLKLSKLNSSDDSVIDSKSGWYSVSFDGAPQRRSSTLQGLPVVQRFGILYASMQLSHAALFLCQKLEH